MILRQRAQVWLTDSRVTGACLICTCVAVKVIEFQAVVFLRWQRMVERFTEGSDE